MTVSQPDMRRTPQHVPGSPSCGTGKASPGVGSRDYRGPRPSVDRRSPDRGIEASQVAGEGRNRTPAVEHSRSLRVVAGTVVPNCDKAAVLRASERRSNKVKSGEGT